MLARAVVCGVSGIPLIEYYTVPVLVLDLLLAQHSDGSHVPVPGTAFLSLSSSPAL